MSNPHPIITDAFLADPYPTYASLREAGPIHWSDEFFGGAWLLTRHADVEAVLRDSQRFSAQRTGGWVMQNEEARGELRDFQQLFARAMLFVDAPDHTRLRPVIQAGFRADVLRPLMPLVRKRVDEMLDAVDIHAGFDFMEAIARPLPAEVMAMLMGIPDADRDPFIAWSDDLATFIGAPAPTMPQARRARTSLLAMAGYFEQLIAYRRRNLGDDLVSRLLRAEAEGLIHPGPELLAQCAMLLFAGHETTRNLLGNGLHALLTHPDEWDRLRRDPSLLPGAVRELLRFDSPVQYTGRRAATDVEMHGRQMRRGDLVIALLGSANRDPDRFEDSNRLDVGRQGVGLLPFGAGPHVCVGASLTQMEVEVAFGSLIQRMAGAGLRYKGGRRSENIAYRGFRELVIHA